MAQQVKFYSVAKSEYTAIEPKNGGAIYFVDGGELYKGASRFGANKVWTTKPTGNAGVIGGDMFINEGVTQVFDGSEWKDIVDITGLGLSLKASVGDSATTAQHGISTAVSLYSNAEPDIAMTVGAVTSAAGITSDADNFTTGSAIYDYANGLIAGTSSTDYIAAITKDSTTGKLTAHAKTFPSLATGTTAGTIKLGDGSDVSVAGWSTITGSVDDLESRVSAIEGIVDASTSTVTATTGNFTNLNVSDTATFSATTVSATTLTVGGSAIADLISAGADARISAAKLSGNIAASDGTGLVNEGQVVTYVSAAIQSFDNAMHYIGTTSDDAIVQDATAVPSDISGYTSEKRKSGDIVIKGTQEFIWNGSKWELIGDQGTYATKAELSALASSISTSWSSLGTAAFVDKADAVTANATTLPTGGAVASYVSSVIDGLAGSASDSDKGIAVEVVTADGQVSTVDVGVTLDTDIGPSTGTGAATDDEIPSSLAVRKAIESAISDATLVWLNASGAVIA